MCTLQVHCTLFFAVPAVLYTVSNALAFAAAAGLPAPVLQAIYQSKLILSAALAWGFLGRSLSLLQSLLLCCVAAGVVVVHAAFNSIALSDSAVSHLPSITSALLAALASAAAGVASESLLKPRRGGGVGRRGVWQFNAQMAMLSAGIACARLGLQAQSGELHTAGGVSPLAWPPLAWLYLVVASAGGLLAGLAVQVAGSVPKNISASCSMVITSVYSIVGMGVPMSWWGAVGLLVTPLASAAFLRQASMLGSTKAPSAHRRGSSGGSHSPLGASSPTALVRRGSMRSRSSHKPPTT